MQFYMTVVYTFQIVVPFDTQIRIRIPVCSKTSPTIGICQYTKFLSNVCVGSFTLKVLTCFLLLLMRLNILFHVFDILKYFIFFHEMFLFVFFYFSISLCILPADFKISVYNLDINYCQ